METKYPKKLNYEEYEQAFSNALLLSFTKGMLYGFDIEKARGLVYGYTFTEDYAKSIIPNELSIEYWNEKNKNRRIIRSCQLSLSEWLGQGGLIYEAIKSTGEGTLDNPYCVICENHEYEFLKSHYSRMKIISQGHLPGNIDWFYCEDKEYDFSETFYFDRSRWFERDCIRKVPETNNSMEKTNQETFTLLNGTVLDCYPLHQTEDKAENGLISSENDKEKEISLFLHNAFRFLHHRDRIMSDSRMFLCPVPIQSGLAYAGTGGFENPTLGVYLEWWINCESALIGNVDKTDWLVYRIAGSPLSGANQCGIVNKNGRTDTKEIRPFSPLFSSFAGINNRYKKAKELYHAYTLKQVVEILGEEGVDMVDDKDIEILFLKSALHRQQTEMSIEINRLESKVDKMASKIDRLKYQFMHEHRAELEAFVAEYTERENAVAIREKEIVEESKELRGKLKTGELSMSQFQKLFVPLKQEKKANALKLQAFCCERLDELFPGLGFSVNEVKEFLKDPRLSSEI